MKSRVLISVIVLMLAGSIMVSGCAPAAEAELKPCEVNVPLIENLFLGTESITLDPLFVISNPNDYEVKVRKLEYEAATKVWLLGGREMALEAFIPAKGEIRVSSAFTIGFINLSLWLLQTNPISMGEAMAGTIPLWKSLDGGLFNPALQAVWDGAPVEAPIFNIKGKIHTMSPGGQELVVDFSTSWQKPEEVQMWK